MKKPSISFFCPAYYDEKNLPLLIPKAMRVLRMHASAFEIVIVDDASPDNTGIVADKLAKKYSPYIRVIHHKKNMDYGGALRRGFREAKKYDYVFYTDGDNQFDVFELKKFLPYLSDYDAIIGYRSKRLLTPSRNIQTIIYNILIRLFFGVWVKDVNCSIKIFKRDSINKLQLQSNSSFIDAEVLIGVIRNGGKIKEIEVTHYPRLHGRASGGNPKVVMHTIEEMITFYSKKK